MPFTYLRAYATELCTTRRGGRAAAGDRTGTGRPALIARRRGSCPPAGGHAARRRRRRDRPPGPLRRPARLADPPVLLRGPDGAGQGPGDLLDRARCAPPCLGRALERQEPYGVWGGEMLIDGRVVAEKRGRGPAAEGAPGRASSSTRSPASRSSPDVARRSAVRSTASGRDWTDCSTASAVPRPRSRVPRRAALHADARRPRRRRHQGRAAGR